MNTKLVEEWKIEQELAYRIGLTESFEEICNAAIQDDIDLFLVDEKTPGKGSAFYKLLNSEFEKVREELNAERWVTLIDEIYFDKKSNGCWVIRENDNTKLYKEFSVNNSLDTVNAHINHVLKDPINTWGVPCKSVLIGMLNLTGETPFKLCASHRCISNKYLNTWNQLFFDDMSLLKANHMPARCENTQNVGACVPFLPFPILESSTLELFIEFIFKGLTPLFLEDSQEYKVLLAMFHCRNLESSLCIDEVCPDISADSADVIDILVSVGDTVVEDQNIITIESDKAFMDVHSKFTGVVEKIDIAVGDTISEGDLILSFKAPHNSLSNAITQAQKRSNELLQKQYVKSIDEKIIHALLNEDKIRADITSYHQKMLEDTDLGHWSLWENAEEDTTKESFSLATKLVARDPCSSINDGVVAIDFGTKSTVVVYQKDNVNIHPMRIGTGDLSKEIDASHYENPTVMEFNNLEQFISDYQAKANKPYTKWQDITISHSARNAMLGCKPSQFNTFLDEIKQWAGDQNRKLKIVGKQGKIIDLPPFLELKERDFNPIELYAYYLGLYINNQNNGIYLDYILSFPVTYELPIRDKIIESFERGLQKSLPAELGASKLAELTVTKGASEPAAYALVALQAFDFEPCDDEHVFYSVFDFGGGTTDFDFGIFRDANGAKEARFDYVIEHFGAGGDKFLGGENLLELLAFEIFKKNKSILLSQSIQFEQHAEKDAFAGSEQLLSSSQEAKINTKTLCEKLRSFWEGSSDTDLDLSQGSLSLNLTDVNSMQITNVELDINEDELNSILSERIERGVVNFFNALRLAFSHSKIALQDIEHINIFLAGNSSKSHFVKEIFEKQIALQDEEISSGADKKNYFKLYEPLGADISDVEKPTGKTGVAFGLIESREGGSIKVIDHNIVEDDIRFKFYLGVSRKNRFNSLVNREVEFNQWNEFIDASYQKFEIFYTDQPSASSGKMPISDSAMKKKVVKLDITDDEAMVYLRVISPTVIEYVVAYENEIENGHYLNEPQQLTLL